MIRTNLMDLLFEGRFEEYFREARLGDETCVFVHVPKTAGSSLRTELAALLQPDVNIEIDYTDTSRSFHQKMDEAVSAFLAGAGGVRFASGHIMGRHVAQIRAGLPSARLVTFLRDPVQRVVSDFRYQRSPEHPLHLEFRENFPTLDDYIQLKSDQNKLGKHLLAPPVLAGRDPEECVDYLLRTYAFIGIQEMYPISFRTLTSLLGAPAWPKVRERVNTGDDAERQVAPELAKRIREANPVDTILYDALLPRWRNVRDALARHLA